MCDINSHVGIWIFHPLSVPALGQLPATFHTHTAGYLKSIYLVIPEKGDVLEN